MAPVKKTGATIQKISQKLGISDTEASKNLAALIPQVIDRLTPEGTVPEGGLLEQGLSILKQKFLTDGDKSVSKHALSGLSND